MFQRPRRTHRIAWLVAVGALLQASLAVAASSEDAFDWTAFRAMSPEQKMGFVLAKLDARDAELRNVECRVFESHVNVTKSGGARRAMNGYSYEVRRLRTTLWMQVRMLSSPEPGSEVRQDSIQNWDGQVGRRLGLPPTNGRQNPDGKIMGEECQCFSFQRYMALLGFRVRLVQRAAPTAQWLRDSCANPKVKIEVSDAIRDGAAALKVQVDESGFRRELWLDPLHGFMIVQYDQVYLNHTMDTLLSTTEVEKIDGIWLPKQAIGHNTTDFDKEFTEVTHELREFHRGSAKPGDVEVSFPVGTSVIDTTRKISYSILPDNHYKLSAFADPVARLIYVPPEHRVVDRIDDSVRKLFVAIPLGTTDRPPTTSPSQ